MDAQIHVRGVHRDETQRTETESSPAREEPLQRFSLSTARVQVLVA